MFLFLMGLLVGMCGVLGTQLVAGRFEPLQIPWRPLPDRLQTLSNWGRLRPKWNPRRTTPPITDEVVILPIRMPGASLIDVPPEDAPLHTSEYHFKTAWWLSNKIYQWWMNAINKYSVLGSDEAFASWWEDVWVNDRKRNHHGRRRREDCEDTNEWRMRWAEHDTQGWPTLATTGNAWDIRANLTVVICHGTLNSILMPVSHLAPAASLLRSYSLRSAVPQLSHVM